LDRLEPADNSRSLAREFGSMWHALRAIDAIYRGAVPDGTLKHAPSVITTGDFGPKFHSGSVGLYAHPTLGPITTEADLLDALEKWLSGLQDDDRAAWYADYPEGPIVRLRAMSKRWHARWDADTQHERVLGVEVKASRNLGGSFDIGGKVDEVYLDTRRNLVVVRDHKSSANMPAMEAADDLMDSQLHLYVWIITPLVMTWGHGEPRALAYDRARTAQAKEPQITKSGTLSKSVTDYDLEAYLAFTAEPVPYPGLKKDGSGAGEYVRDETVVARLSTPSAQDGWNRRTLTPVNVNVVLAHLRAARDTGEDQGRTRNRYDTSGTAPRNIDRRGCSWCDFNGLCRAQMLGGVGAETEYDLSEFGLRQRQ
jgi:hypothetical protein